MSELSPSHYRITNEVLNNKSKNLLNLMKIELLLNNNLELILFDNNIGLQMEKINISDPEYLVPFTNYEKSFIFNKDSVLGKYDYNISQCVYFDTNVVSDIRILYKNGEESQKELSKMLMELEELGMDKSIVPYCFENILKVNNKEIAYDLFKENFIIVNVYMNLGYKKFEYYSEMNTNILSINDEYINTLSKSFDEYYQSQIKDIQEENMVWKTMYALFLKAIDIKYASNKSAKTKMIELIEFVDGKLGILHSIELSIIYKFFKNDITAQGFFRKIQPNRDNIKDIKGMVWDIYFIRMMYNYDDEPEKTDTEYKYFFTRDKYFAEMIREYGIKFILKDKSKNQRRIEFDNSLNNIDIFDDINRVIDNKKRRETYKTLNDNKIDKLIIELEELLSKRVECKR